MSKNRTVFQGLWGVALVLAGIGVFYRLPQVMPEIEKIEYFSSVLGFIRFCFYFMGVVLIGGGTKKIYDSWKKIEGQESNNSNINNFIII